MDIPGRLHLILVRLLVATKIPFRWATETLKMVRMDQAHPERLANDQSYVLVSVVGCTFLLTSTTISVFCRCLRYITAFTRDSTWTTLASCRYMNLGLSPSDLSRQRSWSTKRHGRQRFSTSRLFLWCKDLPSFHEPTEHEYCIKKEREDCIEHNLASRTLQRLPLVMELD